MKANEYEYNKDDIPILSNTCRALPNNSVFQSSMSWLFLSPLTRSCSRRNYTESAYQIARQKWQLGGIPKPKSLFDDSTPVDLSEDDDAVNRVQLKSLPRGEHTRHSKPTPPDVKAHREAIRKAFPEGWSPPRKLSREAMDILRQLHHTEPETFSTPVLAERFKISPEAVRRILKSRWEPSAEKRTALIVKERKRQEEMRQKVKAELHSKKKMQSMNVEELRRLLKNDHFWREKYGRRDGKNVDSSQITGVGATDKFTLR